ncbi:MAG: diaminopimelate epimerase [Candidatus Binatus sp.]|uniref:diaminopimelate epimerase n=1 Tax=Candidatus Binatus sp. TaxID=2811406 RepID=UPI002723A144|nr:diaminopimelate epimerase [Candidatus Binatus sp.]MDO8434626.1 diaminopimelate epimerase [Candidatus Binatus sp.]
MAKLEFTKMHGCGNDYIYVVATRTRPADPAALSVRLSDRHFGVGGDGLIMLAPSSNADLRMEMYNADGSRGDMCGNGIRCLARLAFERGIVRANPMIVETDAGLKTVSLKLEGRQVVAATVDMGEPILEGREIPVNAEGRIIDYPLEVAGQIEQITAVSMGNPHCVIFVGDDAVFGLGDLDFAALGRKFEHHPFFPKRVNTEFIQPISRTRLKMRVWERGSGETWACGTGACAALVGAVLTGHAERAATVELRGGNLEIEWRESGPDANHVFMTGNAIEVFRGGIELGADELISARKA